MIRPLRCPARVFALLAVAGAASADVAGAQRFDRTRPPVLSPPAPLTVPAVRSASLPNGLKIDVVEQHELPLVQVVVVVPGGARLDGDRPGIAAFTASMLDEGAGTRDAVTLQSELAFLGASLATAADWDRTTVSLKVPRRSLGAALDLLADVVLRPTFASDELRRQRDLRLTTILQRRDQPEVLADLAFGHVVYPAGHPYHRSLVPSSATALASPPPTAPPCAPSTRAPSAPTRPASSSLVTSPPPRREPRSRGASVRGALPVPRLPFRRSPPSRGARRARGSTSSTAPAPRSRSSASAGPASTASPRTTPRCR